MTGRRRNGGRDHHADCSRKRSGTRPGANKPGGWVVQRMGQAPPAPSGRKRQGAQSSQCAAELGFPGPAPGQMQSEAAGLAGEPSGQGEEPPPQGLGGYYLLTETDARRPACQVVSHQAWTASQAALAAKRPEGRWLTRPSEASRTSASRMRRFRSRRVKPAPGSQLALFASYSYHRVSSPSRSVTPWIWRPTIAATPRSKRASWRPEVRRGAEPSPLGPMSRHRRLAGRPGACFTNLARCKARIGLGEQIVTTKTLRRRFFSMAGRLRGMARRLTLHLLRRMALGSPVQQRIGAIALPAASFLTAPMAPDPSAGLPNGPGLSCGRSDT